MGLRSGPARLDEIRVSVPQMQKSYQTFQKIDFKTDRIRSVLGTLVSACGLLLFRAWERSFLPPFERDERIRFLIPFGLMGAARWGREVTADGALATVNVLVPSEQEAGLGRESEGSPASVSSSWKQGSSRRFPWVPERPTWRSFCLRLFGGPSEGCWLRVGTP